ncbi:hypothetical protein QTI33_32405 [Variovorax sp. J22P271]|uniref:hypothetical protein n=1 Tax=Variovorax davisae TaxID=3053515 RepID=UPI002576B41D|nr:hypothetical protein [Variovorax sp. J22P271]MDM0036877.1 hypothetical protein [Variovorax sp. J22P271]
MEKTGPTELETTDGAPDFDQRDEEEAERIDALWVAACRHQAQRMDEVLARARDAGQA